MNFLRRLFGGKESAAPSRASRTETLEQSYRDTIGSIVEDDSALEPDVSDMLTNVNSKVNQADAPEAPAVNIWDMEDSGSSSLPSAADLQASAARSPARARRTKTRLIGFDKSDGDVVDIFNDAPKSAPAQRAKFPVGWIVVADGPGRGESFSLFTGMSQIGRGDDQAVQLDFGDNSISRTNHAAIVYDPETQEFMLGHGGKSNIVRLNDKPLISNEVLKTGDVVRIGETVLRFVALCSSEFNWSGDSADGEDDEDVAIA
ncbi:FHA domain-containing protein [Yoonia sediminilitoris]|uniref:PSer/pThr/pTyr-binding forkhead associated (FHA) protein n=1 Tax=Yoonia sediminilitoris TaxID=1286148 RepID=A0A2T6KMX2_9RHOB|nr:FHA domain-containing protein [Yoonia sediminilitoris]PUB17556.1 pSer/pThr/pTyr-binding forkhead associated (FHA) protein [Yoonia sediminilitoris]RCW97851.1 pSer/pThr/pTyr-binding forkhead associated (FHA) protein [Yoonia sediminilitoris]